MNSSVKLYRNEKLILASSLISTLGSGILTITNALVISDSLGTAKAVGTLFILIALPQALFSIFFGKLVDIYDRRKICIGVNITNALITLFTVIGINVSNDPSYIIYCCGFCLSLTLALFSPANNAIIKDSICKENAGKFISNLEMAIQIGALISVAIGGWLVQSIGINFVYILNMITFTTSAMLFIFIKPLKHNVISKPLEKTILLSNSFWIMLLYGIGNIIVTVSNMLLVILVTKHFLEGPKILGIVDALAGLGIILAAKTSPFLQKHIPLLTIIIIGYLADAFFIWLQPKFSLLWLLILFPIGAFFFGIARINCRTFIYNKIDSDYTGRFFGYSNALGLISSVVITYFIGNLVDNINIFTGYTVLAIIIAIIALLALSQLLRSEKNAITRD